VEAVVAAGVVVVVVAVFRAGLVVVAAAALRAALLTRRPRLPLRIPVLRGFDAMMSVRKEVSFMLNTWRSKKRRVLPSRD